MRSAIDLDVIFRSVASKRMVFAGIIGGKKYDYMSMIPQLFFNLQRKFAMSDLNLSVLLPPDSCLFHVSN